jgi:hypothetical protein
MTTEPAQQLPEYKPCEYEIDLNDGKMLLWAPYYTLSKQKLEVLQNWLNEILETGKL